MHCSGVPICELDCIAMGRLKNHSEIYSDTSCRDITIMTLQNDIHLCSHFHVFLVYFNHDDSRANAQEVLSAYIKMQ